MKKIIYHALSAVIGALIFGVIGLFKFIGFFGGGCVAPDPDPTCQCFCCHLFGTRGYESCGDLGLLIGIVVGAILGLVVARLIERRKNKL
jgi:hypothetical protein